MHRCIRCPCNYTSYDDMFTVGAGYLDIAAALANTDKAAGFRRCHRK